MKKQVIYALIFAALIISIILVSSGRFDFNNDGITNILDLQSLASHYQGKAAYNSTFDLNNNGKVDLFDIVAEAKNVNNTSPGNSGSSGAPVPPPVGSSNIVFDMRAGGAQSIQSANITNVTLANIAASTGYGWAKVGSSNGAGYYVYPTDFTPNYDGLGTHAYRFNWKYEGGYNSTGNETTRCYNMNGEQDAAFYFNRYINSSAPMYIQWKTWMGRTATGGGWGNSTIGSYNSDNGRKLMIIYRDANGHTTYRTYFGGGSAVDGLAGDIQGTTSWTQKGGFTSGNASGYINSTIVCLTNYINQVVTFTLYLQPSSYNGADDGVYTAWVNNALIWNVTHLPMGVNGFYEQQFGGPTWICPPQDQTQYYWDWVEWTPS